MKRIKYILPLVILLILVLPASAHQGKTDSDGGHYDRQNGGYHYHHGYPAHQHKNGVCPYDDETLETEESNSNKSSGSSNISSGAMDNASSNSSSTEKRASNGVIRTVIELVLWLPIILLCVSPILLAIIRSLKDPVKKLFKRIKDFWGYHKETIVTIGILIALVLYIILFLWIP